MKDNQTSTFPSIPREARSTVITETTLRDVLTPLFRQRKLVLICFFGILLVTILGMLFQPNRYRARMQILVKRERVDPVVTSEASTAQTIQSTAPVTEEEINSEAELLRGSDLLQKVVLATGLQDVGKNSTWASLMPKGTPEGRVSQAVNQLAKKLSVEPIKKTDIIEVSYETPDPDLAYRVLHTLADSYLEKHLAVHRPPGAFDFFQHETEQYKQSLADAESSLAHFRQENSVASADVERDLAQRKLSEFDGTFRDAQTQIAETQSRIDNLQEQLKVTPARMSTAQRASDNAQVLQLLEGTLATLELKHTDMAAHYDPDYRPLKDLEAQMTQAQAQIAAAKSVPLREDTTDVNPAYLWLTEELTKSRADLATFGEKAASTERNVRRYRDLATNLGQEELQQEDLMRNAKTQEGDFLLYLNKREEARISDALDTKRILNVAIADPPTVPVLPENSPLRLLLLGILSAMIVSVGAGFVADYIDPTLRTADETTKVLEMPVLAAMPRM